MVVWNWILFFLKWYGYIWVAAFCFLIVLFVLGLIALPFLESYHREEARNTLIEIILAHRVMARNYLTDCDLLHLLKIAERVLAEKAKELSIDEEMCEEDCTDESFVYMTHLNEFQAIKYIYFMHT